MNLDTLDLYCSIVLRQSFSRAAVESGVTQAAASQAIQRLEDELGARLREDLNINPSTNCSTCHR